jgi:hypothetical protein
MSILFKIKTVLNQTSGLSAWPQEHGMISPFEANQVRMKMAKKSFLMAYLAMVMMCVVRVNLKYLPMFIPPPLTPKTLTKRALWILLMMFVLFRQIRLL